MLANADVNWENSPKISWCYALMVCPGMQETVLQKIPAALNDGTKIKVSKGGHSLTRVLKMGFNGTAHTRHVFLGSPPGLIIPKY